MVFDGEEKSIDEQGWMFNFGSFRFGFLELEVMWKVMGWRSEEERRA